MAQKAPISSELPDEIKKIMTAFDAVYNSPEYDKRRKKMVNHLALYESELWKEDQDRSYSKAQINTIFSTIEQAAPLLTDNRPIWYLLARSPRYQKLASLYNRALEYVWDVRELDDLTFDSVKDQLLAGKAIVKVFWNEDDEEVDYDLVDPATFCIAPGYRDLWKAAWCGEKSKKPMTWIREVFPDTWMNVKPEGWEPKGRESLADYSSIELERMSAWVYQIWFRDDEMIEEIVKELLGEKEFGEKETKRRVRKYPKGRLLTFTPTTVLRDEESPFDHGKPPYVDLSNYKVNHKFWSMGEVEQIRELHRELNLQLQAVVRQGRINENRNFRYYPEYVDMDDDELKNDFFDGGMMIPTKPTPDGSDPIEAIDAGGIDRRHIELIQLLMDAVMRMSQQTEISEGRSPKKERLSASEYSGLLESSYVRVRQKVRNLESFIKRLNWLTVMLQQQYYDEPRYVSFLDEGEDGRDVGWEIISNKASTATNYYKPRRKPEESAEEYKGRLSTDEDYNFFLAEYPEGKQNDPVYFHFQVQVQSSSTLPKDKQSLAKLYLQLGGMRISLDSPIDAQTVLEGLQIPGWQAILARKKAEKDRILQAKMGQFAPPMPQGAQRPRLVGGAEQ